MAKTKTVFYCTECGNETPKWQGKCPSCGAWNTLQEHIERTSSSKTVRSTVAGVNRQAKTISQVDSGDEIRFSTGMGELDRVLGGGAVEGSLVLVGGAPGIGKSTLLLQICNALCAQRSVLYVSGEESERQLKLRAQRLGVLSVLITFPLSLMTNASLSARLPGRSLTVAFISLRRLGI